MSEHFKLLGPIGGAGARLDRFLDTAISELRAPQPEPRRPIMPGGEFFALFDELAGTERRLDAMARPLLVKAAELELRAARAIEGREAKLDAAHDYITRMESATQKLEGNAGPTLEGSAASPPPSSDAPPSPPASPEGEEGTPA